MHAARFGAKFNVQGALARSKHSTRYIGYLTQYLAKQLGDCHHPGSGHRDCSGQGKAGRMRFIEIPLAGGRAPVSRLSMRLATGREQGACSEELRA